MRPRVVVPALVACLTGLAGLAAHLGRPAEEPPDTIELVAPAQELPATPAQPSPPSHAAPAPDDVRPDEPVVAEQAPPAEEAIQERAETAPLETADPPPAEPSVTADAEAQSEGPAELPGGAVAPVAEAVEPGAGTVEPGAGTVEPGADVAEADADPSEEASGVKRRLVEVGRGDTLLGLLVNAAVPRDEAIQAIDALRRVFNPRSLQVGQEIAVIFEREDGQDKFMGLHITPNVQRTVTVSRAEKEGYEAKAVDRPVETRAVAGGGSIRSSLFEAGIQAGVPIAVLSDLIKLFSYDVDFQRDIQPGDGFRVLFERRFTDEGAPAGDGDILFAELAVSGKTLTLYRFKTRDGVVDYFNGKGESIRKALLRTPVDGARLTSSFGMRTHPILGYSKMHAGVDFAAPTGTPIFAAGAGVVEEVGGKGAYGNYIRIRHNKDISTAYAHLSRFAANLNRGDRVRQGEVIGYVGSTGRSTGPHLHYEVLKGGRQVNPLSVDLPTGQQLEGKELVAFRKVVEGFETQYAQAQSKTAPLVAQTVSHPLPPTKPAVAETSCRTGC